jgi:hypothetical protein
MGLMMAITARTTLGVTGGRMAMCSGITIMAFSAAIVILAGEDSQAAEPGAHSMGVDFTAGAAMAAAMVAAATDEG